MRAVMASSDSSGDALSQGRPASATAIIGVRGLRDPSLDVTGIVALRVMQLFAKDNPWPDVPKIAYADGVLARGVLGVVPAENDGSARFGVPSGIEVYMQGLDERGRAVMNIRPALRVVAGETSICVAEHDHRKRDSGSTVAAGKEPAELRPEVGGSYPMAFARLVQPILDRRCIGCHDGRPGRPDLRPDLFETDNKDEIPKVARLSGVEALNNGWSRAYVALERYAWSVADFGRGTTGTPRASGTGIGASASRLMGLLDGGHGGGISEDERRCIAVWLDANSPFFGAYHGADSQARGQLVPPKTGYLRRFEN